MLLRLRRCAEIIGVRVTFLAKPQTSPPADARAGRESDSRLRERPRMTPERSPPMATRCRCCSDRSNFGEPLDCELVGPAGVPAGGGFPCGPCLRGNVVRFVVESAGVVWQHQVEVGDVDV